MSATFSRAALLLFSALFAAGCASFSAINPGASAQRVETLVGAPASVWKNADGSEVWEYPQGPLGVETYMVTLGSDRAVREVRQVLSDEYISKLHVGMSRDEVRRLLGRPRVIGSSDLNDEEIWSWRYREWGVRNMELYVQFDRPTGSLKKISRFQVDTSDGKRQ
ncbi:MAG TPA: outer membrane protein assembly factor BamE [Burkholderiales bacterium]|nr:outer membrane protein assembly factor BamE [Burkholderiales bacterium]